MVTINVKTKTKKRFKDLKRERSVKDSVDISEDSFVNIILDRYEGRKKR